MPRLPKYIDQYFVIFGKGTSNLPYNDTPISGFSTFLHQNLDSISTYILLIWEKVHQMYTIIMPQNQVVSTYLYQIHTSILTDIYNFGKSTSNLRNDDPQKFVIFDLFVSKSKRYIDIYFAIFLKALIKITI